MLFTALCCPPSWCPIRASKPGGPAALPLYVGQPGGLAGGEGSMSRLAGEEPLGHKGLKILNTKSVLKQHKILGYPSCVERV